MSQAIASSTPCPPHQPLIAATMASALAMRFDRSLSWAYVTTRPASINAALLGALLAQTRARSGRQTDARCDGQCCTLVECDNGDNGQTITSRCWLVKGREHRRRIMPPASEREVLGKVQCEIADIRGNCVIGQTAVGLRNAFLREAEHLWSFVDEQLPQSQCGTGSQSWRENVLCFVGVTGCGEAERKLDCGV